MGGGIAVLRDGKGSAELVGRLDVAMLLVQQRAEAVGDEGHVGVVGTEQLLFDRQRLAVQQPGAFEVPTPVLDGGQVVELDGDLVATRRPAGPARGQRVVELAACLVVVVPSGEHRREYRLVGGEGTGVRARRAAQRHRSARVSFGLFVPLPGVGQPGEVVLQVGQLPGGGARLVTNALDPRVQLLRPPEVADLLAGDGQRGQGGGEQVRFTVGQQLARPLERPGRLPVPSRSAVRVAEAGQRPGQERPPGRTRGGLGIELIHQPAQPGIAARPLAAVTLDFRERERDLPGQLDHGSIQQP